MRKELTIAILAVGMTLGMATMTSAQEQTQNSDVEINVTDVTEVDVRPTTMGYDGLEPGQLEDITERNFEAVEVENIGSTSIIQIGAEADMPDSQPFATGNEAAYNTGNFIMLNTDGSAEQTDADIADSSTDAEFHYVNRLEFRENTPPSYIQTIDDADVGDNTGTAIEGAGAADIGRFRQENERYFYVIYHEDEGSGTCSGDDAELWVGEDVHTPEILGTYDFTNSSAGDIEVYDIVNADGSADIGQADGSVSIGSESYQVYTYCDEADETGQTATPPEGHTIRTRWNTEVTSPVLDTEDELDENIANSAKYILDDSDSPLEPGGNFPINVGVQVPLGTAEGQLETGTMTITATGQ